MIEQINFWGEAWARYFAQAVGQNTLFLALVLLTLWLLRRVQARVRFVVAMAGFAKLLVPLFVPGPDLFSVSAPEGQATVGRVVIEPVLESSSLPAHAARLSVAGVLFLLWVLGASAFLLLPLLQTGWLMYRLRSATGAPLPGAHEGRHALRVYRNPMVALPLSIGIRCRTVFVPPDWDQWPDCRRQVAMYHELAHASRGDGWAQVVQLVARAIYFFHPLVWLLWRLAEDYREMACDDAARQAAHVSSLEYTRQLQKLAEAALNPERGTAGVTAFIRQRNKLLRRVKYQMEGKAMRDLSQTRVLAVVAALALVAIPLSFNCAKRAKPDTGSIKGFVVEYATGVRLAGARVSVVGTRFHARTDQNGEFAISNLPQGAYDVEAQAPGYVKARMEGVTVESSKLNVLVLNLSRVGEPLKGAPSQPLVVSLTWDVPPEPIGGFQAIQNKVRYPEEARKAGLEGRVYVVAVIDTTGTVRHAYTKPDSAPGAVQLHQAAIEAVSGVQWRSARKQGKPVAVQIGVPVIFKLKGEEAPSAGRREDLPFSPFDEPPEPIGGFAAIQQNLRYPEAARKAGVEGRVFVIAVIDTSGVVRKAWVEQGIFAPELGIEDAAVEAVRATRFKPAQYQGKPVSAQIGISVLFKLQG
ncbi:MAG: M56 family metallopeptidase [candidate division KSB1 bacterium]|nr:M56 family metallopeptidase [candidate division KSB1 bacterium]